MNKFFYGMKLLLVIKVGSGVLGKVDILVIKIRWEVWIIGIFESSFFILMK